MDYVNVEKKKKDFLNETDRNLKRQSSFKTFNQFLRRWDSIRPPVRREL
jgi:hypothetical protein